MAEVASAGFHGLRLAMYGDVPCFTQNGVGMRETQLEASKPAAAGGHVSVLYKGPFREVSDDAGHVYQRGQRVSVPAGDAALLRHGPFAEQFLIFDREPAPAACAG
jgi:hypothetical protein